MTSPRLGNSRPSPSCQAEDKRTVAGRTSQNPLLLLLRALWLLFTFQIRPGGIGTGERLEDRGEAFLPFRRVRRLLAAGQPAPPATILRLRFSFKNLSSRANRLLSLIPIPLIVAQPGFRSKTWFLGQFTGDFIGYYEFDSGESAEAYLDSLPVRMMQKRAKNGSLTCSISLCFTDTPNDKRSS